MLRYFYAHTTLDGAPFLERASVVLSAVLLALRHYFTSVMPWPRSAHCGRNGRRATGD